MQRNSFPRAIALVCAAMFALALLPSGGRSAQAANPKLAVNYGPHRLDDTWKPINRAQVEGDLRLIAKSFGAVRFFSAGDDMLFMYDLCKKLGLRVVGTAWIDGGMSDADINHQLDNLIKLADAGKVAVAAVGSECLLRGDVSPAKLLGYVQKVKKAVSVPVTTMDVQFKFMQTDDKDLIALCKALDCVMFSHYPQGGVNWNEPWMQTYNGGATQYALDELTNVYNAIVKNMQSIGNPCPVAIGETGWATAGKNLGICKADGKSARGFFDKVQTWAARERIEVFWFEAFDEPWKASEGGGDGLGPHFGFYTTQAKPKPCYADLLGGNTTATVAVTFRAKTTNGDLRLRRTQKPGKLGKLPAKPRRKGYKFCGWFTKPKGGVNITTKTVLTTSRTFYAQWRKI